MARLSRSSSGGSTNIQDTDGNPINAVDGAINVNVISTTPSFPQETLSLYSEISDVAIGAEVTVLTYTVPLDQTLYLNRVLISSDTIAVMDLQFDTVTNARKRLSYTLFNETFDYSLNGNIGGYRLPPGTVVTVIGRNLSQGSIANFNATLQGVQQ